MKGGYGVGYDVGSSAARFDAEIQIRLETFVLLGVASVTVTEGWSIVLEMIMINAV